MKKFIRLSIILILFSILAIGGCSKEDTTKNYTLKNRPQFNALAVEFDKISNIGLSYDLSINNLVEFLALSKNLRQKLPQAEKIKNSVEANTTIEDLDNNYSLFLKDTKELVSQSSLIKILILKNYLEVTDKIEDYAQDLNGADESKLIKIEEDLKTAWIKAQNNIKQLDNQNKDVQTAISFTNKIIKDLETNITALKANQEVNKSLGMINNQAIEHIAGLKENVKRNQITMITYLQGLIKTIDAKWPNVTDDK